MRARELMRRAAPALAALALALASERAHAQDGGKTEEEPEEIVEVVDDAPATPPRKQAEAPKPDKIDVRGFARTTVEAGLAPDVVAPDRATQDDRVGYERGATRTHAYLDLRYTRDKWLQFVVTGTAAYGATMFENGAGVPANELDTRSGRFEPTLREAYVGIYGERVDLRLGQQRIVWGNSDAIAPNDVLDANDQRNRMQLDPELTKIPTLAARADVDLGFGTLGLVVQPFFVPDRVSLYGTNWSLVQPDAPLAYRRLLGTYVKDGAEVEEAPTTFSESKTPKSPLEGAAVGASLRMHHGKADTSFYYHWGVDRSPFIYLDPTLARQLEALDPNAANGPAIDAALQLQRRAASAYGGPLVVQHLRRHHLGADFATTAGPFVLRADAAFDSATTFSARRTLNSVARPTAQGVIGVEYQNALDQVIVVEAWYMRLLGPELPVVPVLDQANAGQLLFANEDNVGVATLVKWTFFDNLVVETRSFVGVTPYWYLLRPEAGYQSGPFTARVGLLLVDGHENSFGRYYRRNDTAYVTARYSF